MLVLQSHSYTFRADALSDVLALLPLLRFSYCDFRPNSVSGLTVSIETTLPIEFILRMMRRVAPDQLMYRTLALTGDYVSEYEND